MISGNKAKCGFDRISYNYRQIVGWQMVVFREKGRFSLAYGKIRRCRDTCRCSCEVPMDGYRGQIQKMEEGRGVPFTTRLCRATTRVSLTLHRKTSPAG